MLFFSNFFNFGTHTKKIEQQAESILELSNNIKACRINKEIVIIDSSKNKIIKRVKDTFPSNTKRAIFEISKQLSIDSGINKIEKKQDIWTCGFRDNEARWIWYSNSKPKMTVNYDEAFQKGSLEDKVYFFSARYGTHIISKIKAEGLELIAKEINAFILERSYVKVACSHCKNEENYTIDDLVDSNKQADYSSENVVCQHCNELIKLL